jgi:hypothetical protein
MVLLQIYLVAAIKVSLERVFFLLWQTRMCVSHLDKVSKQYFTKLDKLTIESHTKYTKSRHGRHFKIKSCNSKNIWRTSTSNQSDPLLWIDARVKKFPFFSPFFWFLQINSMWVNSTKILTLQQNLPATVQMNVSTLFKTGRILFINVWKT